MKTWITVLCAAALLAGCAKKDHEVEAPDVVDVPKEVDGDKIQGRDGVVYFEEAPFTGVAVWKHENGQKSEEAAFKDGKMDGLATGWHENGQKSAEVTHKDGKPNGLWTAWYDNGQKKGEATVKDGKPADGLEAAWYSNGQKKSERTWKADEVISEKRWDRAGNPLVKAQESTVQKRGTKAETPNAVDFPPAVVVDLDQLQFRGDFMYLKEALFTGVAVSKYKNGQKHGEITYKGGKLYGLWTSWGENGQKLVELTYKDSKKDGLETWWYNNGQKRLEFTFRDGKRISSREWDKDGNRTP